MPDSGFALSGKFKVNRQNVKNYLWLVVLLPLLSGCESQALLVKKNDEFFAPPKTELPPTADGRAGGCSKRVTSGR